MNAMIIHKKSGHFYKIFSFKIFTIFYIFTFFYNLVTGFGGEKWSPFIVVSPFGMKKWSLDEKVGTAPTNLRFQHFYTQFSVTFRECSDHFLRGEIFHENFKFISKKIKDFLVEKKFRKNKNSTSFLKKF